MSAYRLYHLDGAGRVALAEWLEATDDASAREEALKIPFKAIAAELWQGNRRLARLGKDGLILDDGA